MTEHNTVDNKSFLSTLPKPVRNVMKAGVLLACGASTVGCSTMSIDGLGGYTVKGEAHAHQNAYRQTDYCARYQPAPGHHPAEAFARFDNISYQRTYNYTCLQSDDRILVDHLKKTEFNCKAGNFTARVEAWHGGASIRGDNGNACGILVENVARVHGQGYEPSFLKHLAGGIPWDGHDEIKEQCGDKYTIDFNYETKEFSATCGLPTTQSGAYGFQRQGQSTQPATSSNFNNEARQKLVAARYNIDVNQVKKYDEDHCKNNNLVVTAERVGSGAVFLNCIHPTMAR